jgi:hypothetical protein
MYKLCGTGDLELQNTTINGECHGFTEFLNGSIKILWMFQITQCLCSTSVLQIYMPTGDANLFGYRKTTLQNG